MTNDTTELVLEAINTMTRRPSYPQIADFVSKRTGREISRNSIGYHIDKLKKERRLPDKPYRPIVSSN